VAEATAMVDAAEQAGVTLAVFHNRRHDGNYRAIRETIASGAIGDVFHIEVTAGGYGHPGPSWRSSREVSGGALYDWGAHAVDWVLTLIPSRVTGVTGFAHKLVWADVTNEDQARAILHFENGAVADVCISSIAAAGKPLWRILGTWGAIVDTGEHSLTGYCPEYAAEKQSEGHFQLIIVCDGRRQETTVPYALSTWGRYYEDLAAHLRHGGPVPVSGQDGRRVIAVLETAQRSAASGRTELLCHPKI
jgi:predicted dehydrogenase